MGEQEGGCLETRRKESKEQTTTSIDDKAG